MYISCIPLFVCDLNYVNNDLTSVTFLSFEGKVLPILKEMLVIWGEGKCCNLEGNSCHVEETFCNLEVRSCHLGGKVLPCGVNILHFQRQFLSFGGKF